MTSVATATSIYGPWLSDACSARLDDHRSVTTSLEGPWPLPASATVAKPAPSVEPRRFDWLKCCTSSSPRAH
eukprot:1389622-Amorphochlora_amoeboformis.AAC.1